MEGWHREDRSLPMGRLPLWVWVAMLLLTALPVALYALRVGDGTVLDVGISGLLWTLVLIIAHEGVHAVAWKGASRLPWSAFHFGVMWKTLSPYCHADRPVSVRAYRIGAAAPLFATGLLPWTVATVFELPGLAFAGAILIGAAAGDLYILWSLRDLRDGALIQDHASQVGCIVLYPSDARNEEGSPDPTALTADFTPPAA